MHYSEAAFDLRLRWEPFASLAAGLVEKIRFSRESLLPDGFARHITEEKGPRSFYDVFGWIVAVCSRIVAHCLSINDWPGADPG